MFLFTAESIREKCLLKINDKNLRVLGLLGYCLGHISFKCDKSIRGLLDPMPNI